MMNPFVTLETAKIRTKIIHQEAINRLKEICYSRHNIEFFNRVEPILINLPINWKKMGFTAAGKTIMYNHRVNDKYEIRMNINYLYSVDAEKFIQYTLLHELAHVIANVYNGTFGHDRTFKAFARILGDDGNRCCDYQTPINKPKDNKIGFLCTKCGTKFMLTPYMVEKCKTGKYTCSHCHTNMKDIIAFYGF